MAAAAVTPVPDVKLGFGERAIFAVLVNPLDVAKKQTNLGFMLVPFLKHAIDLVCTADCFRYKQAIDVFCKVIHQGGMSIHAGGGGNDNHGSCYTYYIFMLLFPFCLLVILNSFVILLHHSSTQRRGGNFVADQETIKRTI